MTTTAQRRVGEAPDPATLDPEERMGVTVEVEARPDCPPERRAHAGAEVARLVKETVGTSVDVAVVDPETLERSVGKLKRLVDLREKA